MNTFSLSQFIKYRYLSRYRKGYGVHSPFAFKLIREVIGNKKHHLLYSQVAQIRRSLLQTNSFIERTDLGAKGSSGNSKVQIAQISKRSAIKPKYGKLLSRLVMHFNPKTIIELGTSLGISTSYLALANTNGSIITIEGCNNTAKVAQETFNKFNLERITSLVGHFDQILPATLEKLSTIDMVFIDGNHTKDATLKYFNWCLEKANNNTVLIFDDINWSHEMSQAWQVIYKHPKVTVSIDLFQLGIVFFKKECQKQHYLVRY